MPDLLEQLKEASRGYTAVTKTCAGDLMLQAAAEIARLRARPTEREVALAWFGLHPGDSVAPHNLEKAKRILALFPKVQP